MLLLWEFFLQIVRLLLELVLLKNQLIDVLLVIFNLGFLFGDFGVLFFLLFYFVL